MHTLVQKIDMLWLLFLMISDIFSFNIDAEDNNFKVNH